MQHLAVGKAVGAVGKACMDFAWRHMNRPVSLRLVPTMSRSARVGPDAVSEVGSELREGGGSKERRAALDRELVLGIGAPWSYSGGATEANGFE